jgi:hypothetical protein
MSRIKLSLTYISFDFFLKNNISYSRGYDMSFFLLEGHSLRRRYDMSCY